MRGESKGNEIVKIKSDTRFDLVGQLFVENRREINRTADGLPHMIINEPAARPAIRDVRLHPNRNGDYLLLLSKAPDGEVHVFPCHAREFVHDGDEFPPLDANNQLFDWALNDPFPADWEPGTWTFQLVGQLSWRVRQTPASAEFRLPLGKIEFVEGLYEGREYYRRMGEMLVYQLRAGRDSQAIKEDFNAAISETPEDDWIGEKALFLLHETGQNKRGFTITQRRLKAAIADDNLRHKLHWFRHYDIFCKALNRRNPYVSQQEEWMQQLEAIIEAREEPESRILP